MKKLFLLAFAAVMLIACGKQESCNKCCKPDENLIESKSLAGLWQQMKNVEIVDDESGETITTLQLVPRYKCIMEDGTYYLLNCTINPDGILTSFVDHYGTYELQGDSIEIEHINTCSTNPSLAGVTSTVRYSLIDQNTLSMYYNFGIAEGSEGSNEWVPETWKRVLMD